MATRGRFDGRLFLLLLGAGALAVLFGLVIGSGSFLATGMLATPFVLAAVLAFRVEQIVLFQLVVATVLAGSASYFGRVGQMQWLPAGIGVVLYVQWMLGLIGGGRRGQSSVSQPSLAIGLVFLVLAVGSTAWEMTGLLQWAYGYRFYFSMAALLLVFAHLPIDAALLVRCWRWTLAVVAVQVPVALYQYVVVAGRRVESNADGEAWDAVVGTMGGSQEGGGLSSALGLFVVAGFVVVLALWKARRISLSLAAAVGLCAISVIFLAEVKAMALLMPMAVLMVLREQILLRVRLLAISALAIVVTLAGMPVLYSKLHYERAGRPPIGAAEFYGKFLGAADSDQFNRQTGEMGRVTQLVFWQHRHSLSDDPKSFLLGHGLGSTNYSRLSAGDVARKYFPLRVGTSSFALMLWEVGVLGVLVAIAGLGFAAIDSFRLSRNKWVPAVHRALLEAGGIILVLGLVTLVHKQQALKSAAVQFLLFLSVGQAIYWRRHAAQPARPA